MSVIEMAELKTAVDTALALFAAEKRSGHVAVYIHQRGGCPASVVVKAAHKTDKKTTVETTLTELTLDSNGVRTVAFAQK